MASRGTSQTRRMRGGIEIRTKREGGGGCQLYIGILTLSIERKTKRERKRRDREMDS